MNLTRDIQVAGPYSVGEMLLFSDQIPRMLGAAKAAGVVPADRADLDSDSDVLFVEDAAGKLACVAVYFDAGNGRLWLDFLYTDEPLRNRGLGRALLKRLAVIAKEHGYKRIIFGTSINNAPMRHLAQRAGFYEDSINMAIELGKDAAA